MKNDPSIFFFFCMKHLNLLTQKKNSSNMIKQFFCYRFIPFFSFISQIFIKVLIMHFNSFLLSFSKICTAYKIHNNIGNVHYCFFYLHQTGPRFLYFFFFFIILLYFNVNRKKKGLSKQKNKIRIVLIKKKKYIWSQQKKKRE